MIDSKHGEKALPINLHQAHCGLAHIDLGAQAKNRSNWRDHLHSASRSTVQPKSKTWNLKTWWELISVPYWFAFHSYDMPRYVEIPCSICSINIHPESVQSTKRSKRQGTCISMPAWGYPMLSWLWSLTSTTQNFCWKSERHFCPFCSSSWPDPAEHPERTPGVCCWPSHSLPACGGTPQVWPWLSEATWMPG